MLFVKFHMLSITLIDFIFIICYIIRKYIVSVTEGGFPYEKKNFSVTDGFGVII